MDKLIIFESSQFKYYKMIYSSHERRCKLNLSAFVTAEKPIDIAPEFEIPLSEIYTYMYITSLHAQNCSKDIVLPSRSFVSPSSVPREFDVHIQTRFDEPRLEK